MVAINPDRWYRQGKYDKNWDQELWDHIENGRIEFVGGYEAVIAGGKKVWIENVPYANGQERFDDADKPGFGRQCSRTTALLLEESCKKRLLFQKITGPHHAFKDYGVSA